MISLSIDGEMLCFEMIAESNGGEMRYCDMKNAHQVVR